MRVPGALTGAGHPPLRVLLTTDAVGGIWSYALDLADGLRRAGAAVLLAVFGPAPDPTQRRAAADAEIDLVMLPQAPEWLAADGQAVAAAAAALAALARRWRADLLHLNSPALAADAAFPCPVVAVHHSCVATWWAAVRGGPEPADFAWRTALTRRGFARVDAIAAPSAAFAATTAAAYGLPALPVVVRNGRSRAPRVAPLADAPRIFTAGRLWDEGKGVAALDRAAQAVRAPIVAAGPTRGPNGSSLGCSHLVLTGALAADVVRRYLAARPIYVAPARYEPFGLAVLEAAQAGCPLVLNDLPTFREMWGGAAVFVDAGDAAELSHALNRLSDNACARDELGAAARSRAQRYTLEAMVAGTRALYARALGQADERATA